MSTYDSTIVDECFVSVLDEYDDLSTNDSTNLSCACPYTISSIALPSLDSSEPKTRTSDCTRHESKGLHRMNVHKSISKRQNLNSAIDHNDYLKGKLQFCIETQLGSYKNDQNKSGCILLRSLYQRRDK